MNWLKSSWFLVASTLLLVGIVFSQTLAIPKFSGINSFKIQNFSDGKLEANTELLIKNENWFSYSGKNISFKMYYKDHLISLGRNNGTFKFLKKSESKLLVEADFYADSLFDEFKTILFNDSIQVKLEIKGSFTFFKVPISQTITVWIKTKEIIDVLVSDAMNEDGLTLNSLQLNKVNATISSFKVAFKFENKLPFSIVLKDLSCFVYSDESKRIRVAQSKFNVNKSINANEVELIQGDVSINHISSLLSGFSKVINGELIYYLNGIALIEVDNRAINIPIEQKFKIDPLNRKISILTNNAIK